MFYVCGFFGEDFLDCYVKLAIQEKKQKKY